MPVFVLLKCDWVLKWGQVSHLGWLHLDGLMLASVLLVCGVWMTGVCSCWPGSVVHARRMSIVFSCVKARFPVRMLHNFFGLRHMNSGGFMYFSMVLNLLRMTDLSCWNLGGGRHLKIGFFLVVLVV